MRRTAFIVLAIIFLLTGCRSIEPETRNINSKILVSLCGNEYEGSMMFSAGILKLSVNIFDDPVVVESNQNSTTITYGGMTYECDNQSAKTVELLRKALTASKDKPNKTAHGTYELNQNFNGTSYSITFDKNGNILTVSVPSIELEIEFIQKEPTD